MKYFFLCLVAIVAVSAQAKDVATRKITVFRNNDAIAHVINGRYLYSFLRDKEIVEGDVSSVSVSSKNSTFTAFITYSLSKETCNIQAETSMEVVTSGGITSSRLTDPKYRLLGCR